MGFIRNNNVWKINKILAGLTGGVTPEDVQDMIDTSIQGKQDTLTAGDNITISDENVISATVPVYTAGNGITVSDENVISLKSATYISWDDFRKSYNYNNKHLLFYVYVKVSNLFYNFFIDCPNYRAYISGSYNYFVSGFFTNSNNSNYDLIGRFHLYSSGSGQDGQNMPDGYISLYGKLSNTGTPSTSGNYGILSESCGSSSNKYIDENSWTPTFTGSPTYAIGFKVYEVD